MLEAVNSVLQTSNAVRAIAEQASTVESFAANPDRVQKVAQAPYVSPYVHYDTQYNRAVLALRDAESGDFIVTIPSDATLEYRSRDEARRAAAEIRAEQAPQQADTPARSPTPQPSTEAFVQVAAARSSAPAPSAPTPQQLTAFASAAQSGGGSSSSSSGGGVSVFA